MQPRYMPKSAWRQHIPFAFFLMAIMEPKKVVELGTYLGASYFSFCQAVKEFNMDTKCYAVDTWKGDAHAGHYEEDVYKSVLKENFNYEGFSSLLKNTFNEASKASFARNIDLCHIDGFHSYEAVKSDFETWVPKMSEQGVMLFHDTAEMREGFGVWRFWSEVSREYPSFDFQHGHGLGVLLVGKKVKKDLRRLAEDKYFYSYEQLFKFMGLSI